MLIAVVVLMVAVVLPMSLRSLAKLELGVLPEMELAQKSGKPVEVVGQRTATDTTWARPDGFFRREISAVPVRARVGERWVPIDLNLVRKPDGSIAPKAAAEPAMLSGGGDSALLVTTIGGVEVAIGWPGKLPAPKVKGASATYVGVFPGVDLQMTVTTAGVSQVLVVKSREAAQNPALRKIRLSSAVSGGLLRASNGGFAVVDADGREVGVAPQPVMWDSSNGTDGPTEKASSVKVEGGPSDSNVVSVVGLTVGKSSLVLRPDVEALTGADVTYPVMIDPQLSTTTLAWTGIRQQNPTASYYKWTYDTLHAGFQGNQLQRLFWTFNTASLADAQIQRATFVGNLAGTYDCDPRGMQLWRTSIISSTTTWNNQPSWTSQQGTFNDQAAAGCGVYGDRVEVPVTSAIVSVAGDGYSSVTFGMRASTESSSLSAKWFTNEAAVNVIYKFPPNVPTNLSLADPTLPCGTTPVPTIGGVQPRVSAYLYSPDYANLRAEFEAYAGTSATGPVIWSETQSVEAAHGAGFTSSSRIHKTDGTLPDGSYTWRVRAVDPDADFTDVATAWVSCTFKVDSSIVAPPGLIVPSGTVWSVDANPVSVTLDPTYNVNDLTPATFAYYRWSVNSLTPTSDNVIPVGTDKRSTISVAPTKAGPNVVRIWGYNSAGSVSEPTVYSFDVTGVPSGYKAQYLLDEGTGNTSADETTTYNLSGTTGLWTKRGAYRADGQEPAANKDDYLLRFAGTESAPPQTTGPVILTNQSYTVSAWVRPDEVGDRVAVSQGTATQSNFTLGTSTSCASPSAGCYRFGVRNAAGTMVYAESARTVAQDLQGVPPAKPRMVHLVGDISKAGVIRLRIIVDGVVVENRTTSVTPSQVSSGPLLVGAGRTASSFTNKWKGDIDNVMVRQGLLDDVALIQLHSADSGRCYKADRIDQGPTPCAS